jgi:photosystem II stability/assembly factor-like uncharacterized protein
MSCRPIGFGALLVLLMAPASLHADVNRWTPVGPPGGVVQAIAIAPSAPSTIYAGTKTAGIFKSTDTGSTWTAVNNGIPPRPTSADPGEGPVTSILALAVDPASPLTAYAGTLTDGMYKTADGGAHWTRLIGVTTADVRAIAIVPQAPQTVYAAGNGGLFKTTNGGDAWVFLGGLNNFLRTVAIDPQAPNVVYVGGSGSGVNKSTDGGATWASARFGLASLTVNQLAIDPQTPATVYAATRGGVFKTTNGGTSWVPMNVGLPSGLEVLDIAVDPAAAATVYIATQTSCCHAAAGVYKSIDGAAAWSRSSTGLSDESVSKLAVDPSFPNRLYAGSAGAGLFATSDGAATWTVANSGLFAATVTALVVDPVTPSILYAGTEAGIFKTTDGGATWAAKNTGLTDTYVRALAVDPTNPASIFAAMRDRVYHSADGGASWSLSGPSGVTYFQVGELQVAATTPATIYASFPHPDAGFGAMTIWKSTDDGVNFTATSLKTGGIKQIAVDPHVPTTLYVAAVCIPFAPSGCVAGGALERSTDGGATWQRLLSQDVLAIAIDPVTPSTLYAGLAKGGILKSVDAGATWTPMNRRLFNRIVQALAIDPSEHEMLYAATAEGGVFRSADGGACWAAVNDGLTTLNVPALVVGAAGTVYAGTAGTGVLRASFANIPRCGDQSEIAVYRGSTGEWFTLHADGTSAAATWGAPSLGDVPVLGDYDGDGRTDLAVYRPAGGLWIVAPSASPGVWYTVFWGGGAGDVPVPADYDGNGRTDVAIYRSADGQWFIKKDSGSSSSVTRFGSPAHGDVAAPADYDGDGKADVAVFRTTTGEWFIRYSSNAREVYSLWGAPSFGDVPVPRDYDGDGKADVAVYRTSTAEWFIASSAVPGTAITVAWGAPSLQDVPVPGDYDADGKVDIAVYRKSTGEWFIRRSSDGGTTTVGWGAPSLGDVPLVRPATLR